MTEAVQIHGEDGQEAAIAGYQQEQPAYTMPPFRRQADAAKAAMGKLEEQPWAANQEIWARGMTPEKLDELHDKWWGGGQQSYTQRNVIMTIENSDERFVLGCQISSTVVQVKEVLAAYQKVSVDSLHFFRDTGQRLVRQKDGEEIATKTVVRGLASFTPPPSQVHTRFQHPIMIMGAGLGGLQTAIILQRRGFEDFQIVDRCADFGGASWICVANRFTKLQTERSTYALDYIIPEAKVPTHFGETPYKTWPSRDQLLTMFRVQAEQFGLRAKTRFNTSVEKVQVKGLKIEKKTGLPALDDGRTFMLHTVPCHIDFEDKAKYVKTGDGEVLIGSACICWPGNLCGLRTIDFPGEDTFDGYIAYSSFDMFDYTEVKDKKVILYGHGAFVIENVRTLLEHQAKKVIVMCRKRNICGMRAVSWWVNREEQAVPGGVMLDLMQKMYDLVGFDVWTAHSVKTDEKRQNVLIDQSTVFGVTDVYFLAGYYGLMEVVVDEIKRLSRNCAHCLKSGRKITDVGVICKAVGTLPNYKNDKLLGVKEMRGFWINGDPLMPCATNGMFVNARNFGGFSSGPGFVPLVVAFVWFLEFTEDWKLVAETLPKAVPEKGGRPCHIVSSQNMFVASIILSGVPGLAQESGIVNSLKSSKTKEAHPAKEYLGECKKEWEMYITKWKEQGMIDDRPAPAYPYTEEVIEEYTAKSNDFHTAAFMAKMAKMS